MKNEELLNTTIHKRIEEVLGITDLQVDRSLQSGIKKGGYCVETGGLWFGQKTHDMTDFIPDHWFKWRKNNQTYGVVLKGEDIPLQKVEFDYNQEAIDGLGGYHNYKGQRYRVNENKLVDILKSLTNSQE